MSTETLPAAIAPARRALASTAALRLFIAQNANRWRRLAILEAIVGVLAALLGYFLVAVVLDGFLHLPVPGRLAVNAVFVLGALWLLTRLVRRLRALRLGEDEVALAIERQTPGGLQNRLINTVQLSRESACGETFLVDAIVHENCSQLTQTTLPPAVRARPAILRSGIAGALLVLGVALILWQPARFWRSAARVLLPLASVEPAYRTILTVEPGDIEAIGDIPLNIEIQGERPDLPTISTNTQGIRDTIVVDVPEEGAVAHTLIGVSRSLTYTVKGNDFTSPTYHISVPTPAALSLLKVTFTYPDYCKRDPRTSEQASGELEALQGTVAHLDFVLDQAVDEATLLLDRVPAGSASQRLPLEKVGAKAFRASLTLEKLAGYRIESRQASRATRQGPRYAVRLLVDQEPKLELIGLSRQVELQPEALLPLDVRASDDYGLRRVGLFTRRTGTTEDWRLVADWPGKGQTEFRMAHSLLVSDLQASEGDRVELALRAVDTDPLKNGRWSTGPIHTIIVGGEGVLLQTQYEQILKTEAGLKALLADQKKSASESSAWVRKLDGDSGIRWDEQKNLDLLHASAKQQSATQLRLQRTSGKLARGMVSESGDLRLGLAMLADTEMNRAHLALAGVPGRDGPAAKRTALADARSAQERTVNSLVEMIEAYSAFRSDWELTNMLPFVRMLADRQKKLAESSPRQTTNKPAETTLRRQQKILDLVSLIRPAFSGLASRLESGEPILSRAFANGAKVLGPEGVQVPLRLALQELLAGCWSAAGPRQAEAARQLTALYEQLNDARAEAARQLLATLRDKARSNTDAQKSIEKLKTGTSEAGVKDFPADLKIEDIIRNRELSRPPQKRETNDGKGPPPNDTPDGIDRSKLELLKDSGVRQDPNILSLGNRPESTIRLPNAFDTERNKVKPFVQEKFQDLVGKLLEEADEIDKNYQTLTLSTNLNNNDPGDIAKQGGRINSTGAVAATGNKKPPTTNHGGVSRSGRSGARAYGSVLGEKSVSRRGRDQAQEGEQRVPDQAGTIKETKGDDPYTDTSTGVGGKKVESEHTDFSVKDAGKWTPDMLDRMDKPQKKFSIVERKGAPLDPRLAALLRDTTSKQAQLIERLKSIRKELKTLYLPTDHVDRVLLDLGTSLERLKERPDPELFRLQLESLDRLRGAIKVFRGAGSSLQPSLPRERVIRGRVLDEPGRQTLPGYEGAVKRYYERLANP